MINFKWRRDARTLRYLTRLSVFNLGQSNPNRARIRQNVFIRVARFSENIAGEIGEGGFWKTEESWSSVNVLFALLNSDITKVLLIGNMCENTSVSCSIRATRVRIILFHINRMVYTCLHLEMYTSNGNEIAIVLLV